MVTEGSPVAAGRLTSAVVAAVGLWAGACAPAEEAPAESVQTPATEASATYEPTPAERDAILRPLQDLFDALETGDAALLRSVVSTGTLMSFVETRDGATTEATVTVDQLADRITSSPEPLIERMWDPEVRVAGRIATIWTPYDFYVGDELSHCGIDAATLIRGEDGWKIVGLSWTRDQPPACTLHPEGPPAG